MEGAGRAAFAAKVIYVAASLLESALLVFSLAAVAVDYLALRAATRAAEKAAEEAAERRGIELTEDELEALFKAAQEKCYGR